MQHSSFMKSDTKSNVLNPLSNKFREIWMRKRRSYRNRDWAMNVCYWRIRSWLMQWQLHHKSRWKGDLLMSALSCSASLAPPLRYWSLCVLVAILILSSLFSPSVLLLHIHWNLISYFSFLFLLMLDSSHLGSSSYHPSYFFLFFSSFFLFFGPFPFFFADLRSWKPPSVDCNKRNLLCLNKFIIFNNKTQTSFHKSLISWHYSNNNQAGHHQHLDSMHLLSFTNNNLLLRWRRMKFRMILGPPLHLWMQLLLHLLRELHSLFLILTLSSPLRIATIVIIMLDRDNSHR